jgi:phthalate 4,5-dioxygenase
VALTRDDQERLVRVGPGTPAGRLFRRYWVPILLRSELLEADGDPVPVRILGEDLIAFRDTSGAIGLVQRACPHRGASLFFGRNEEGGLRCSYHGWKFNTWGQCIDMPSEPSDSAFADKVRIASYPCIERGDLVLAYLGPPELQPAPPELEWLTVPDAQRHGDKRLQETNYLQALEGALDSSHVAFLHKFDLDRDRTTNGSVGTTLMRDHSQPRFSVAESPWGLSVGAWRDAGDGRTYWRVTPFIMPWYTIIPPYSDRPQGVHAFVPIDDENTWCISWYFSPTTPISAEDKHFYESGGGIHSRNISGTFVPRANKSNQYLIDRTAQRERRSFSGVAGIAEPDAAIQESMGPIQDRTTERLGTSDTAIIRTRALLLRCTKEAVDGTAALPALNPADQQARAASFMLPAGEPFMDHARDAMRVRAGTPYVFATLAPATAPVVAR